MLAIFSLLLCFSALLQCHGNRSLLCNQYANDLAILSSFPFAVTLDYRQQGPDKSMAILDASNTLVVMIQLRQPGGVVPEAVFCLKHLQSLEITNMAFPDGVVPETLANLQQLHTLTIENTPIVKMTEQLGSLYKLQSLTLDNCGLRQLPNLRGLYKLARISVPNNRLSKLEGLVRVSSMSLYKNDFTEIPTLAEPEALRRLDMNFNPVLDISNITTYANLTDVRLSDTLVSDIPENINELESLYFFDLSHSRITSVPRVMLSMPYLQFLVVQRNAIPQAEVTALQMEVSKLNSRVTLLI